MLGDNPMQSELACHIGLRGKLFCRACWVSGEEADEAGFRPMEEGDGASDNTDSSVHSAASAQTAQPSPQEENTTETIQDMVRRVKRFLSVR